MKRKIPLTLAALALFGLPACGGGASAAGGKLIPEQATIMAGIDVAGLMKTRLYTDHKADLEKQAEWKEVAEAAKGCNLDPEKAVASVLIGTDGKDGVAAVITGDGIGDEKNLQCVADKAKEKNGGKAPFTIVDEGGKKTLKSDDGKGTGWIVDGRTIAFASKPWETAVKDLIDGKGKPATDGPNKDLFARADQSKHIWAAGLVPADAAGAAKGMGADPKDFSGSFDLSNGLAVKATVSLASAEQAEALKKKADEGIGMLKGLAPMMGLPPKVADSVSVSTKGAMISVEASITNDDIKALKEKAGGMLGGMMGGGGGGDFDAPPPKDPAAAPPADPAAAP
jgi:hypothetical protein